MDRGASRPRSFLHLTVFLGLAASTVAVGDSEWRQLFRALGRTFHSGAPPLPALLVAGAAATLCALGLVLCVVRRRPASLALSVGILLAFLLSLWAPGKVSRRELAARTPEGANVPLLGAAQAVQAVMVEELRRQGEVPTSEAVWQERVEGLKLEPSVLRGRFFRRLPYRVVQVGEDGRLPQSGMPGSFVLYVSPDGARFTLTPIGLDAGGAPGPLTDAGGTRLVLRGVFH